jgi:glycerophosphoryl diester phosphodiesterase
VLVELPTERRTQFIVSGGHAPVAEVRRILPEMTVVSRRLLEACLTRYIGYGWTGLVPETCRNLAVLVPINVAPWLWGWPNRFLDRMEAVNASVFVIGPYHGNGFSTGIDTPEDLARLPESYSGGIWTNRIEWIGPTLKPDGSPLKD